ncbi:peptidase inhibitor 16 isoform X1 [Ursus maritimus]|uniref:Peptidase inhibitor 16 n=1 Tax=Ursus maritimus TaxID=29073 RepID=A0A8M1H0I0_URSMA|nr:peptidase inhibitor 16 isoform X1 [Ursus maritimus]XP_040500602.1 peptidase inhibitor 16 isoform X1 [Ursus maritimus]
MHGSCSLLLLLLAATVGPAGALSDDEKRAMVELHNLYRAQVSPPAADMLQMRWDEELAAFAKAYAQQCVWGHNKERGRRGENLFAITEEGLDVPLAMEEWHHEREHYNLSAASCDRGQMCGHYTQVVWAKTERIGCGSHFCEKLQGVEEINIQLLVCNYEPPGNVKGKRPYQEGTPCSLCPSGYRCENSLCEPIISPEEAQDLPHLVTEAPSSLATEASGSRKSGIPSSLATETTSSLVTEVSSPLATKAPPAVETEAPSSLATEDSLSMATEAPPSLTTEVPPFLATHSLFSLDEGPAIFPKSTHNPISKLADEEASRTRVPSVSPESSLHPKVFLTGTREPLPHSQKVGKAEAELSRSSEVLASVFPGQGKTGELPATLDHTGHTSSKSLSNSPNTSATANAVGGRTLALQSSLPGADGPEKPSLKSGLNSGPGHVWGPLLGLLLLPPLVLAGIF